MNSSDSNKDNARRSKVASLIENYDLGDEFGQRLEDLWTTNGDQRKSLRSLADLFNKRLLHTAMSDAGMTTLDGEVDNVYRLLTNEDVSSGSRTDARKRLEQHGVDVESLEQDFVTYQAIRSYLKEYRGAEYQRDSANNRVDTVQKNIQQLQSRIESVTRKSLTQLRNGNDISIGEFRIFVDVKVLCEDCNTQYGIIEFLKGGNCECTRTSAD